LTPTKTETMLAPDTFLDDLAAELRRRGCPAPRCELRQFVADFWGLIVADPCVGRWATAYQALAGGLEAEDG
jgi:hypothetical protein